MSRHDIAPGRALRGVCAALLMCAVAFGAAGCGEDETLSADNLEHFGVAKDDLPPGYERARHASSRSLRACIQDPGAAAALANVVPVNCDSTSYAKTAKGSSVTNTLAASVILLGSERDAAKAMLEMRKLRQSSIKRTGDAGNDLGIGTPHSLGVSKLGDEAPRGVRLRISMPGGDAGFHIRYYCWRRGAVAACAGSSDILGDFDAKATLELARTIDRRIAAGLS